MNFKELYDDNRKAISTLLTSMWCGDARNEQQKKQAEKLKGVIEELFAPSAAVPVVQCMNLYKGVHSVAPEVAKALVGTLWKESYSPYEHQYQCWNTLLNKKTAAGKPMSICVTTGTGSGKTECFMMPLVHDLIQSNKTDRIQALFLYPLNALMEDQKERLEKMLAGTSLTYAVYNGDLPEKEPKANDHSEDAERLRKRIAQIRGEYSVDGDTKYKFEHVLYTRKMVRDTPPNILLTNPTMLEYVLLRQADATLIDPLLKSLRWVAIDETHSYTGAGAAELAMLLRRVLLAFNVNAEDVRFATSSATFGNATTEEAKAEEIAKLKEFIRGITGLKSEQIEVVDGQRMGEETISDNPDKPLWQKICKADYISIADLFPEGAISEKLGKLEEMCQREDAVTGKTAGNKMKVKVHYFYRVPNNGFYARLTEQKDGGLAIYTQNELTVSAGVAPLLEVTRCKHCGGFVSVAMYDSATGEYAPMMSDESDMFDIEETEGVSTGGMRPIMLGIRNDIVTMGDGNVMLKAVDDKLENVTVGELSDGDWHVVGNTNYRCPHCNAKVSNRKDGSSDDADDPTNERYARLQRFRLSAEVISRYLAPSILNQLERHASGDGDLIFHDGQQYISFVDSRQAAAISTLKQNLEQEQRWVYSTIFHALCRRKAAEPQIKAEIAQLTQEFITTQDQAKFERIGELNKKVSGCMSWMEIFDELCKNQYCDKFLRLFAKRSTNSEEMDAEGEITPDMKAKYVHSVMSMYLAKRPKSAPSPETLGLFHATYPQLKKLTLPASVQTFNGLIANVNDKIGEQDWRDLLQIFLDHTVRSNQSVFFKEADAVKIDIFSLNRFATEKPRRRPVKRLQVNAENLGIMPRVVQYLGSLLSGSDDMAQIRNAIVANLAAVNAVLDDFWKALTVDSKLIEWGWILHNGAFEKDRQGENDDEPYRMNLVNLSFKLYDKVRLCDVNGGEKVKCLRPVEVVFKDRSLYSTKFKLPKIEDTVETWDVYPYYEGSGQQVDVGQLTAWAKNNRKLLCDGGIWGEDGLYKNKLDDIYLMPDLFIQAEHTAQVDKEVSRTLQADFKAHRINILACSTTMEMGVDLGNLEVVMLSSVPPMPANYKQRAGRSGRNNKIRSACMTLCGSDAVGLRTLFNPIERLILRPVEVPKVDLLSEQVVKRHVNSYLIRAFGVFGDDSGTGNLTQKVVDFFTPYGIRRENGKSGRFRVIDPVSGLPILPTAGMGNAATTRYRKFINKCNTPSEVAKVKPGLQSLLRDTCFPTENDVDAVIVAAKESLTRCYQELSEKIEDVKWGYVHNAAGNPKFQLKLEIQYLEILNERLINYWATHRFTPNANMPVNVLPLDLNSTRDISYAGFSSNPSYSLREALSQYVPGNCVVVDGIVYKVRGIEFQNMYNHQVNTFKWIQHNNEIVKICEEVPMATQWPINEDVTLTLIQPTGFMPDFNEDYTRIIDDNVYTHVSAQLIGASDWTDDDGVTIVSVRTNKDDSGNAKILYYNEGTGYGYCFCSKCGRMVLEVEAASGGAPLPPEMNNKRKSGSPDYHLAMNGKKFRQKCVGSNPQEGVYRNVIIGDLIQTDYSEIRLRDPASSKWIGNREANRGLLYTLAIAFSQSLVEVLGKERGSVDFAITPTGRICIFDTNPGGAGYSNQLKDETLRGKVVDASKKLLEEAKAKDAADILLDKFTVRHLKDIDVDGALAWLNAI